MTLGDRICVMHDGVIQQVAEPMEVYDRPVNRFVAGFLGTPPMNFFDGKIRFKEADAYFTIGSQEIKLTSKIKSFLADYRDREMVLGIRPEHLLPEPLQTQNQNGIDCTVAVVEPLGDRMDVYFETETGNRFVANVDPHVDIRMGQAVTMYIDVDKVNIFELGDIGNNITLFN